MTFFDVIVVGAGPAGAVSALKCAKQGYNTLLLERERLPRHKPCGGIIPILCADLLEEEFGLKIPPEVMCSPKMLGLFYVPPSGRKNSGSLKNYRLFNINRDLFDQWLCRVAEGSGVQVLYGAEFLEFQKSEVIKVLVKDRENMIELKSRYLIGADGVFSKVRKQLYPDLEWKTLTVLQEYWRAKGDFDEYFYAFFKEDITPYYAYLIPKNGFFVIGTGVPRGYPISIPRCLNRFKKWLRQEFAFEPVALERKEIGAIPYHSLCNGEGNVILVGDAAGFCNPFSGEGIRLAIESGIAASEAMKQAEHSGGLLSSLYARRIEGLKEFIRRVYEFSIALTDKEREKFVTSELKRVSLGTTLGGASPDEGCLPPTI